jgi:hypothetical protein
MKRLRSVTSVICCSEGLYCIFGQLKRSHWEYIMLTGFVVMANRECQRPVGAEESD